MKQEKVKYKGSDLAPYISEDTLKYHRNGLAADYVKNYNNEVGDRDFNYAGALLHNLYFAQFCKPSESRIGGAFVDHINEKFGSFDEFKKSFSEAAMSIQGSGWVYLDNKFNIKTIKNHKPLNNVILIVDWWEHAWALDYKKDKSKYLKNIWKIIDWNVINDRISNVSSRKASIMKIYNSISKTASDVPEPSEDFLYHGTKIENAEDIRKNGLSPTFGDVVKITEGYGYYMDEEYYSSSDRVDGMLFFDDDPDTWKYGSRREGNLLGGNNPNDAALVIIEKDDDIFRMQDSMNRVVVNMNGDQVYDVEGIDIDKLPPFIEHGDYFSLSWQPAKYVLVGDQILQYVEKFKKLRGA